MYTVLLTLLFGAAVGTTLGLTDSATVGWSVFWGIFAAIVSYGVATFLFRRALGKRMAVLQETMAEGQKRMQARAKSFEFRPGADPRQAMKEMEAMSGKVLRQAIELSGGLEPFVGWVPLMSRQIATMRMQFHYQLKEFDKVDALLPKCMILDPMSASMKLAQLYRGKTPTDDIRKAFDKVVPRLKYNQSILPYSLMAWIYVQDEIAAEEQVRKATSPDRKAEAEERRKAASEAAYKVLVEACRNNEHDTLKRNRDKLANQKVREFSNAGLAEQWYALFLETPKIQQRRVMPRADGRPF